MEWMVVDPSAGTTAVRLLAIIALSISAALPTLAQDAVPERTVPDALRPTASATDTYVPSLGDIMGNTQLRHAKLWFAGTLRNWGLAGYELNQIEDSFADAARLYRNIPIEKITMIEQPLMALDSAIKAKDRSRFVGAFRDLTGTCNACHQAATVGFITIHLPASSPFTNQSFAPTRK